MDIMGVGYILCVCLCVNKCVWKKQLNLFSFVKSFNGYLKAQMSFNSQPSVALSNNMTKDYYAFEIIKIPIIVIKSMRG